MKRIVSTLSVLTLIVAAVAGIIFFDQSEPASLQSTEDQFQDEPKKEIKPYREWLLRMQVNPLTGNLTQEDVLNGFSQVKGLRNGGSSREGTIEWEELGPNNVGGRTRAMLVNRDNPSRMYAGGVSGGIFVSDNGGLLWTPHPQNAEFESLLISSIAQAQNGDIYFGTGESYISFYTGEGSFTHGFTGTGIYKSTDGGNNFTLLESTVPTPGTIGATPSADWAYVNRIATHPTNSDVVIAATNKGLKISLDAGGSWVNLTNLAGQQLLSRADDASFDADGILHAVHSDRYYRSTSNVPPYTMDADGVGFNIPSPSLIARMVIAVAPSNKNYVYAYASRSGAEDLLGIYRSTDGGVNFSSLSTGTSEDFFNPPGEQGTWNLCIAVNPVDEGRIYIGGQIESWSYEESNSTWDIMTGSYFSPLFTKYIHADHHFILFHPTNPDIMYFGSDGGINRTLNARNRFPDFTVLNKGYNVTQYVAVAGGYNGDAMGGTQDNSTPYVDYTGNSLGEGRVLLGGDGGAAEISKLRPSFMFAESQFGAMRRSANYGSSFTEIFDCNIDRQGGDQEGDCKSDGEPDGGGVFVTPFILWEDYDLFFTFNQVFESGSVEYPEGSGTFVGEGDEVIFRGEPLVITRDNITQAKFYMGLVNGLWVTPEPLKNSTEGAPEWFKISNINANFTAFDYSTDGDILYAGTSGGAVYRFSGLSDADWAYNDVDTLVFAIDTTFGFDPETMMDTITSIDTTLTLGDTTFIPSQAGITQDLILSFSGYITGIDVDPSDDAHVIVSRGGYGVNDNIRVSTNATATNPTFSSISSALPNIPVYDVYINRYEPDIKLAATEFGVWSYDSGSPGSGWTQETGIIGNVPVMEIRDDVMRDQECAPIYIGTHGRGIFRAINHVPSAFACDFALNVATGIEEPVQEDIIAGVSVYPNPATDQANISLQMNSANVVTARIYDLQGRLLMTLNGGNMSAGSHTIALDLSGLSSGTYLVSIETGKQITSRKIVKF